VSSEASSRVPDATKSSQESPPSFQRRLRYLRQSWPRVSCQTSKYTTISPVDRCEISEIVSGQDLQHDTTREMSAPPQPPPPGFGLPDDNHNVDILVSTAVTTGVALIIVCMRIYVRSQIVRSIGGDDWWIVAATVCVNFTVHLLELPKLTFENSSCL